MRRLWGWLLWGGLAATAAPAPAVLLASANGGANTSAPADDPGWANVGERAGLSAVYLGNTWVLTAHHVGVGDVSFGGVVHTAIPGSGIRLLNDDGSPADLLAFRIMTDPGLPAVSLRASSPAVGTSLVMIGHGRDRGAATTWFGIKGFLWAPTASMRWGTNVVSQSAADVLLPSGTTRAFATSFSKSGGTSYEAQAAVGDSGGAVFVANGSSWQLAGIMVAVSVFDGQPAESSLYGNLTYAADVASYKAQLDAIVATAVCSDGLDNDGDGLLDAGADPGCRSVTDRSEQEDCSDGLDNDGDGLVDYPADPGCASVADGDETAPAPGCGLLGSEALGVVALLWARRRRRAV